MGILCVITFCLVAFTCGIGVGFAYRDKLQIDSVKLLSHCCASKYDVMNASEGTCYYKCCACGRDCKPIYWQKR